MWLISRFLKSKENNWIARIKNWTCTLIKYIHLAKTVYKQNNKWIYQENRLTHDLNNHKLFAIINNKKYFIFPVFYYIWYFKYSVLFLLLL